VLRADVESALRKLAVDLPLEQPGESSDVPRVISERVQPDAKIFAVLSKAMRQRKSVSFTYHSMNADRTARRQVDPYGLFFTSGHWYLAGRDGEQNALRNYRLLRMLDAAPLNSRQATPDFEMPAEFSLREHARARHAWELGDDTPLDVLVTFDGDSGQTVAAAALGQPVDGAPRQRRFLVRRGDAFARWILSFAGEARIVSPISLAQQVGALAAAARARYADDSTHGGTAPSVKTPLPAVRRTAWDASSAAAKLKRLLLVMPLIADGEEHDLVNVAARIGCTVEALTDDLHSLAPRTDVPGGFIDKVSISITARTVSAESQHLRRPMRLTMSELCALDLGLAVLRTHRPPDEHPVLDRARRRLRDVIVALSGDVIPDALYNVSLGELGSIAALAEVRDALRHRRKIRIAYRKSGSTVTDERVVCPCALLVSHGMLYLVAHCDRSDAMRIFRMDRVADAVLLDETFTPAGYDLDAVARDGRVFMGGDHGTMLVRYSPKIARWIAEREGRTVADDGSLVVDHALADVEWAVRHVLQYGPDAEVLSPPSVRARVRQTLDAMSV
jgi:predicted DNA-binding transcriptional regulator YafY